jgi:hypothetical protein
MHPNFSRQGQDNAANRVYGTGFSGSIQGLGVLITVALADASGCNNYPTDGTNKPPGDPLEFTATDNAGTRDYTVIMVVDR